MFYRYHANTYTHFTILLNAHILLKHTLNIQATHSCKEKHILHTHTHTHTTYMYHNTQIVLKHTCNVHITHIHHRGLSIHTHKIMTECLCVSNIHRSKS